MKTNTIKLNIPKNTLQYLIGFSLYLLIYHSFNPLKLAFGLLSFLITYSSIYPYNDLMDYKDDKKSKWKKAYKSLARGELKHETAITFVFGLPIIGILLSSFVSLSYTILLVILLLLNFLYSAPQIRLKKKMKYALVSMFLMQFIKFSLGWFTFTTNMVNLPVWIITTFSLGYLFGYVLYKKDILNMKKSFLENKKILVPLSILILLSFFISFMIYPYKIPLLLTAPIVAFISMFRNQKNKTNKLFKLAGFTTTLLTIVIILFLLLNVPVIAKINNNASQAFNKITTFALNNSNNKTKILVKTLNETIYSYPIHDLTEFNNIINVSNIIINVNKQ